ncbi:prolactin-like [Grus japonensis]|uniref:Prolactin-like n=1 Tax=Grus japonensis TaxID=30415 RepID=A0ABC9VU59_GRUJA
MALTRAAGRAGEGGGRSEAGRRGAEQSREDRVGPGGPPRRPAPPDAAGLFAGAAAALALLWLLVCAPGDAGCRLLSVADLFDRVIRHSGRIHSLSTALYAELEKHFPPRDNELGKPFRKCHTSGMLTPNGKEYAQKIPDDGGYDRDTLSD